MEKPTLNAQLDVNSGASFNIRFNTNDNAVQIYGRTADGVINRSEKLDDPELETKLRGYLQEMADFQKQELAEYVQKAEADFADQLLEVQAAIDAFFSERSQP